jgi:hypothetical protein
MPEFPPNELVSEFYRTFYKTTGTRRTIEPAPLHEFCNKNQTLINRLETDELLLVFKTLAKPEKWKKTQIVTKENRWEPTEATKYAMQVYHLGSGCANFFNTFLLESCKHELERKDVEPLLEKHWDTRLWNRSHSTSWRGNFCASILRADSATQALLKSIQQDPRAESKYLFQLWESFLSSNKKIAYSGQDFDKIFLQSQFKRANQFSFAELRKLTKSYGYKQLIPQNKIGILAQFALGFTELELEQMQALLAPADDANPSYIELLAYFMDKDAQSTTPKDKDLCLSMLQIIARQDPVSLETWRTIRSYIKIYKPKDLQLEAVISALACSDLLLRDAP